MRAIVAAVLVVVAATEHDALAYCRETTNRQFVPTDDKPCDDLGKPLFWRSKCVGYDFQKDASANVTLAEAERVGAAAFAAWANADCGVCPESTSAGHPSISAVDLGPVACSTVEYNQDAGNANVIMFRDGAWPHGSIENSVALTTVHFDLDTGEIYDADIEINGHNMTTTDDPAHVGFDLQTILTHESGHFLGLAHPQPDRVDAVMHPGYVPGRIARTLSSDDVCGICAIYPPARAADCAPTPRHGFASACAADQGGSASDATFSAHGGCSQSKRAPAGLDIAGVLLALCVLRRRQKR